jgi:Nitroreductase family
LKQQDGLLLRTIINHGDRLYAKRNTLHWDKLFNLLAEPNKLWTKDAALLVVVISRKNFEHNEKYSITHQYDAGAAWENLALEASSRELVVHGMQGFDYEKARIDLEVPDSFDVMAMIAIGKKGPKDNLSQQLQEREYPSDRKPLVEIVMEGEFRK